MTQPLAHSFPAFTLCFAVTLCAACHIETPFEKVPENHPPAVQITLPAGPVSIEEGSFVEFAGSGGDIEDGALGDGSLAWTSSLDGLLGIGGALETDGLSVGTHVVTLFGTDSEGLLGSASVSVTITAFAPGTQD